IILFMIPLKFGEEWKVPIAKLADILSGWLEPAMPMTAMIIIVIAAIGSLVYAFIPRSSSKPSLMEGLFKVTPFWVVTRIIGAVFAIMVT
ncbi:hypothetical protein, partial [Escherichia coli]|uniref:hypothetical protein n=1 Tax=Escherichia coli TaxID=562 RepID=UPI001CCFF86F